MVDILWFRNDLRLYDNESFSRVVKSNSAILIYIYDKTLINRSTVSFYHLKFIDDSLRDLSNELNEKYNASLNIYYDDTINVFRHLSEKYQIENIFSNRVFKEKASQLIDNDCGQLFLSKGIEWVQSNQFGIQINHRNRKTWSRDWRMFTTKKIEPLIKSECNFIRDLNSEFIDVYRIKNDESKYRQSGGTKAAKNLLNSFLSSRHQNYQFLMSSPLSSESSCSRLSPHITYGTVSIRDIVTRLNSQIDDENNIDKQSLSSFKKRLAWHCHFIQKFYDEPAIEYQNMNRAYDGLRDDSFDESKFNAWKTGTTGFPFIDACMRFVRSTGWLNFRMRAMLVSFASYQLWLDWRLTSKHLSKYFTDYEPGIHYSQFQMQSGTTGINTIRIYNPIKQSYDQDPGGDFIRKWIPELSSIPNVLVHEPWKLSPANQLDLGIKNGNNYSSPIVDNTSMTKVAREKIWNIKKGKLSKLLSVNVINKHASNKK